MNCRACYAKEAVVGEWCRGCYAMSRIYRVDPASVYRQQRNQGDKCGICFELRKAGTRLRIHQVDGDIKGLLCYSCSTALRLFQSSPERLRQSVYFLQGQHVITPAPPTTRVLRRDAALLSSLISDTTLGTLRAKARALAAREEITEDAAMSRLRRFIKENAARSASEPIETVSNEPLSDSP